jgi:hypothetical protein
MPGIQPGGAVRKPEELVEITDRGGRFRASYYEWNGERQECCEQGHLTRRDALECAEQRLRYRS